MSLHSLRSLILIVAGTVVAVVLVRVGIMLVAWQAIPETQTLHSTSIAWIEMCLWLVAITGGAIAAWRVLSVEHAQENERRHRDHLAEVGELASGLSHEMRNYINAMRTHVALLRKTDITDAEFIPKWNQRIQRLEDTTCSLEELLADFLTYAKPTKDSLEEIGVDELIGEVIDFVRLDLEQAGVDLLLDVNSGISPVYVDRVKLKRVILNLLLNARQAMPEGGTISVRVSMDNDYIVIEISDTGCGISDEDQRRIFDSFFSTKAGGVGLGLSIVKRTIEGMRGSIGFESAIGRGTTFRIFLPSSVRYPKDLNARSVLTFAKPRHADSKRS